MEQAVNVNGQCQLRRAAEVGSITMPGVLARPEGIEPTTLGSEDRCSIR